MASKIYNSIMIKFEQAIEEIKKDFPIRKLTTTYAQIETDILFDSYNYIFIGVLYEDGKVILIDNADYAQLMSWSEEEYKEIENICKKHNLLFINWNIECDYISNQDVKNYLDCLLELKEKYIK